LDAKVLTRNKEKMKKKHAWIVPYGVAAAMVGIMLPKLVKRFLLQIKLVIKLLGCSSINEKRMMRSKIYFNSQSK
jgi:hypothetical protein